MSKNLIVIYDKKLVIPENGIVTITGQQPGLKLDAKIAEPLNWPNPNKIMETEPGTYNVHCHPETWGDPARLIVFMTKKNAQKTNNFVSAKFTQTKTKKQWAIYLLVAALVSVLGLSGYTLWKSQQPADDQTGIVPVEQQAPAAEKKSLFETFKDMIPGNSAEESQLLPTPSAESEAAPAESFTGPAARDFETRYKKPLSEVYQMVGGVFVSKKQYSGDMSDLKDQCAAIGGKVPNVQQGAKFNGANEVLWSADTKGAFDPDSQLIVSEEKANALFKAAGVIEKAEGVALDKLGQKFGDDGFRASGEDDSDYQERLTRLEKKAAGINEEAFFKDGRLYLDTDETCNGRCILNQGGTE